MEAKKSPKADLSNKSTLFFSIGLFVSLSAVVAVFESKTYDEQVAFTTRATDQIDELIDVPVTEQLPPPPAPVIQPKVVEVPDEEKIEEEIQINIDVEDTEETKVEEIVIKIVKQVEEKEDDNRIFTIVEEQASFEGGNQAALQFMATKLKYPSRAQRMGVEGKVFCQFVVNRDGSLEDVKVLRGIGAGCDEEAVRVIKLLPPWKPAKQRGRPVRSIHSLFVQFQLL